MNNTNNKHNHHLLLTQLQALKSISKHLQNATVFTSSINQTTSIIKPFLDLHFQPHSLFSNLNLHLSALKTQLQNLEKSSHFTLNCFLIRYRISRLGFDIYKETQRFLDRVIVQNLVEKLEIGWEDGDKIEALVEFIDRLGEGFDGDFQELVLTAKVFSILEKSISDDDDSDITDTCSKRVKEAVSVTIEALVRFNRNVFLGLVMMGSTIQALISMKSSCSIQVLSSLIKLIRTPLVDELHSIKKISEIVNLLLYSDSDDLSIKFAAMECICEIAYLGRREVIESMIRDDLIIHKLMELQRKQTTESEKSDYMNWVVRFAVQIEVGEGLCSKEKMEVKVEILKRIKEASVSESEESDIVAEVLWGSSP